MNLVRFRKWLFSVDETATTLAYAQCLISGADECTCDDCRNYAQSRTNVPEEVAVFFKNVGIDYRKESEVWRAGTISANQHWYFGWYHFKGQLLEGTDCKVNLGNDSSTLELESVSSNFSIGFTQAEAPSIFTDKTNLVQIEFSVVIPWVLGEHTKPDW